MGPNDESGTTQKAPVPMVKLRLTEFSESSPELWFLAAEAIFRSHQVAADDGATRFSYLLQSLEMRHIEHIATIIQGNSATQYSDAKEKLLSAYGDTEEKKNSKVTRFDQHDRN